jgi:hypothetical protein
MDNKELLQYLTKEFNILNNKLDKIINNKQILQNDMIKHFMWNDALIKIKEELTEITYNTWIKTISCKKYNNHRIILEVPNLFHKNIVKSKYANLIDSAVNLVSGKKYKIYYTVKSLTN